MSLLSHLTHSNLHSHAPAAAAGSLMTPFDGLQKEPRCSDLSTVSSANNTLAQRCGRSARSHGHATGQGLPAGSLLASQPAVNEPNQPGQLVAAHTLHITQRYAPRPAARHLNATLGREQRDEQCLGNDGATMPNRSRAVLGDMRQCDPFPATCSCAIQLPSVADSDPPVAGVVQKRIVAYWRNFDGASGNGSAPPTWP